MRIAVFLGHESKYAGGARYELTMAGILRKHESDRHRFVFVVGDGKGRDRLRSIGLDAKVHGITFLQSVRRAVFRNRTGYRLSRALGVRSTSLDRLLREERIDLVYFLSPSALCEDLSLHNYVYTLWDLCHRDHVEFPEVRSFREFEYREELYARVLKKAVAVTVDSRFGKEQAVRRYGLDEERVVVLPFLPPESAASGAGVDVRKKYGFEGEYVFYPAQFWAHKNHIYILDALRLLKEERGVIVHALFSGSDTGNLGYVMGKAREYGLGEQVRHVGFVDAEEIPSLYRQALALVMPTWFGPTNLPPLEAFSLGCPVCYPNLEGLRDQVSDAAFLIDLDDPGSLVERLLEIRSRPGLVSEKKEKGKALVSGCTEEDIWRGIAGIFDRFAVKRRCWPA